MDAKKVKRALQTLESNRKVVEQQWTTIRQFVMPYHGQFFRDQRTESAVEWLENRDVFDSTAIDANNTLASSLHGAVTNPAIQWFDFTYRDKGLRGDKEAQGWAFDAAGMTFQTLRDSNFNLEMNETYLELTGFGTSFISKEVEEDSSGRFEDFVFAGIPLHECYFEQDHRGKVLNFYRKMKWSAKMIMDKFGENTDNPVPDSIKQKAEGNTSMDMDIEIVYCVWKRELGQKPDITKVLGHDQRPYGAAYYIMGNHGEGGCQKIGKERGYYTMPIYTIRWRRTADSMWGNSPAMIALPDILTLNELVELILNSLEKVVDPAIITTERGLLSQLDLRAGGISVLRSMDQLDTFESRARFDVAELHREKLQESINRIFYVDQLQMKESPAMTATEVQVRYELMQRLLGPTLGRLESDVLDPLVMSTLADLMRYGIIPPPPQSVMEAGDPRLVVRYTGPMARAQKMDQVQSIERFAGAAAQLGEVKPEVLDVPNWDQMLKNLGNLLQIDPNNLNSNSEVKRIREDRRKAEDRMQEAQITEQEGRAEAAVNEAGGAVSPIRR